MITQLLVILCRLNEVEHCHLTSSLLSGESGGSNYSIGRYPESNDIDTFSQLTAQDGEGRG